MFCKACGNAGRHAECCGYLLALEKLLHETNRFFWTRTDDPMKTQESMDRLRAAWVDAERYDRDRIGDHISAER
jgi:hypothetical protein